MGEGVVIDTKDPVGMDELNAFFDRQVQEGRDLRYMTRPEAKVYIDEYMRLLARMIMRKLVIKLLVDAERQDGGLV